MLFESIVPFMAEFRRFAGAGMALLVVGTGIGRAAVPKWTDPTPAELSMKDELKAPGAPAVVLSYEEVDESESAEMMIHVRIKILTDGGVSAGNIELNTNEDSDGHYIEGFYGRTIHSDGTVIPYVPGPTSATVTNGKKAIALPQVQVGSIVEYSMHYAGRNNLYTILTRYLAPKWQLQGKYFVRSAHLTLNAPSRLDKGDTRWVANLPPAAELKRTGNRIDLQLADVPAVPDEPYMPPASSAFYNVRFFYYSDSRDKYWGETGDRVDYFWSGFDAPTKGLTSVVHSLIQPGDDDETKLRKLYAAVEKLENTDLTRVRSEKENAKAEIHELRNSEDIWNGKRADSEMITLLFIAMAKAAGYQAYPMAVSSRNDALFDQNVLSWSQVDSTVAIVVVNGHEIFFDPGTRMCPFGRMAPWHSNVTGVSTEAKLVKIRMTPSEPSKSSRSDRTADVTLAPDGSVTGTIKLTWTGTAGLMLRREYLRDDLPAVKATIEKEIKADVPEGVELKLGDVTGLEDGEAPLVAMLTLSGKMGQATKKRMVLPAQFFASAAKPVFTGDARSQPIAFSNAYVERDQMRLHLPPGFNIESLPDERSSNLMRDSMYGSSALTSDGDTLITTQRAMILNRVDYKASEYGNLHQYFSQVAGYDQDQIVVDTPRASTGSAGTN